MSELHIEWYKKWSPDRETYAVCGVAKMYLSRIIPKSSVRQLGLETSEAIAQADISAELQGFIDSHNDKSKEATDD